MSDFDLYKLTFARDIISGGESIVVNLISTEFDRRNSKPKTLMIDSHRIETEQFTVFRFDNAYQNMDRKRFHLTEGSTIHSEDDRTYKCAAIMEIGKPKMYLVLANLIV